MHDLLLGFLVACALCAVLVWVVTASHHRMMVMVAKQRTGYRLMDGKFYYLVEESEYLELQKAATTSDHANYFDLPSHSFVNGKLRVKLVLQSILICIA